MEWEQLIQIIFVGNSTVGKTSIFKQFLDNTFNDNTKSTIGLDINQKHYHYKEESYLVRIIDTAGQERYKSLCNSYFKNVNGVILVYDVTDRSSFEQVSDWLSEIQQKAPADVPIILVGNKIDLEAVIETEKGKKKAEDCHCMFKEVSAKTGMNVQEAFNLLIENIIDSKKTRKLKERLVANNMPEKSLCC